MLSYYRLFNLICVFLTLLIACPGFASNSDAYKYWKSGNYQAALKIIRPAAKNGDAWSQTTLGIMYVKGQGVEKNDKEAVKWFTKASGQDDLLAYHYLARIYEKGGDGVSQDYRESAKWYLKIAEQRHFSEHKNVKIFAQQKAGFFYADGTGVKQDYKQAVKWLTGASEQGDLKAQARLGMLYKDGLGVSPNPAAAQKWLQLSAAGMNSKTRAILPGILAELDVDGYLYARARWLEKFPAFMKPFGIVLGKRFPVELDYDPEATFDKGVYPAIGTYVGVIPTNPVDEKLGTTAKESQYTVYTTNGSDIVYKVMADLQFDSEDSCRHNLDGYFNTRPGAGTEVRVVSNWGRVDNYDSNFYEAALFIADFGDVTPPINPQHPLKLDSADKLSGVRLILSCRDRTGQIIFAHFPSVEKSFAENIESVPWWAAFYTRQKSVQNQPVYFDPFGITLGRPLVNVLKQDDGGDDTRFNFFYTTPPRPHKLFSEYSVLSSRLTESVISVRASGRFKNREHCYRVLDGTATGFMKKFGSRNDAKNTWDRVGPASSQWFTFSFQLIPNGLKIKFDESTSIYSLDNGQLTIDSAKAEFMVNVQLSCIYTDNSYWSGRVEYTHPLTEAVASAEQQALNLLVDF